MKPDDDDPYLPKENAVLDLLDDLLEPIDEKLALEKPISQRERDCLRIWQPLFRRIGRMPLMRAWLDERKAHYESMDLLMQKEFIDVQHELKHLADNLDHYSLQIRQEIKELKEINQ